MAHLQCTDVQDRPTEFLDVTSLTLDEFQPLVPPFEAAFQGTPVRHGAKPSPSVDARALARAAGGAAYPR